jgi:cell shape-determining protein MreC
MKQQEEITSLRSELAATRAENKRLREALEEYNKAASKFIAKVKDGRARSVETYADLNYCILVAEEAMKGGKDDNMC